MKRPRRSVATSLFVALAVVSVFVVAIAGCSGSNDEASTPASKAPDASQVKDDNLKTLNVGSDLYPPFVYADEYGDIVGLDVEILTEALARIGYKPEYQLIDWEKEEGAAGEWRARLCHGQL
ncbi:MAG: transporter substrate-binding domain-containing protein [Collinsella sp.]